MVHVVHLIDLTLSLLESQIQDQFTYYGSSLRPRNQVSKYRRRDLEITEYFSQEKTEMDGSELDEKSVWIPRRGP